MSLEEGEGGGRGGDGEGDEELSSFELVLNDSYRQVEPRLIGVYASPLIPQQTSQLLKILQFPQYHFEELTHLKRVRKKGRKEDN
jgi:hypothetical protein